MAKARSKEMRKIENLLDAEKPNRLRSINSLSSKLEQASKERTDKKSGSSSNMAKSSSTLMAHLSKMAGAMADQAKLLSTEVAKNAAVITKGSLKAVADASLQMSRAIGQDINWNKQAIMAQALSKSTPIFGYFAAKFMETDVFKNAADKIKQHIGGALQQVGDKFGSVFAKGFDKVRGLFGGKGNANNIKKNFRIPSMAVGGYVAKEGLINVHPAEVIMPIDKVMNLINSRVNGDSFNIGDTIQRLASINRDYMDTYRSDKKDNRIFFRTFLDSIQTQNEDMLIEIKRAIAGNFTLTKQIGMAWQKTLELHPGFRAMVVTGNFFSETMKAPFRMLFRRRGATYAKDLPRDQQPLTNQMKTLHVIYTGMMWQFDHIGTLLHGLYVPLRDMATKQVGKKYPETIERAARLRQSLVTKLIGGGLGNVLEMFGIKGAKNYLTRDLGWKTSLRTIADPLEWFLNKKMGKGNIFTRKLSMKSIYRWNRPKIKLAWRMFKSQLRIRPSQGGMSPAEQSVIYSAYYNEAQIEGQNKITSELHDIKLALEWQVTDQKRKNFFAIFSGLASIIGSALGKLTSMFSGIGSAIGGLASGLGGRLGKTAIGGAVMSIGSKALGFAGKAVGKLTGGLGLGGAAAAGKGFIKNMVSKVGSKIGGSFLGKIVSKMGGKRIASLIASQVAKKAGVSLIPVVGPAIGAAWMLYDLYDMFFDDNDKEKVTEKDVKKSGGIMNYISGAADTVKSKATGLWGNIKSFLGGSEAVNEATGYYESASNKANEYAAQGKQKYNELLAKYTPEQLAAMKEAYMNQIKSSEIYDKVSKNYAEYAPAIEAGFMDYLQQGKDFKLKLPELYETNKGKVVELATQGMNTGQMLAKQLMIEGEQLKTQYATEENIAQLTDLFKGWLTTATNQTQVITNSISNMVNSTIQQTPDVMTRVKESASPHIPKVLQGMLE